MCDYRPTALSLTRMPWSPGSVVMGSLFCRIQFQQIQPFLDRILEVRLEDLAADPRTTMQAILRFVGEPWDDAVLDHLRHASRDDVAPLPWFATATRERASTSASERDWRTELAPAAIRIIERLNRPAMQRYGYKPAALEIEPGPAHLARVAITEAPEIARATPRLLAYSFKIDRHMKGTARFDPQKALEASLGFNPGAWRFYPGLAIPTLPAL